VSASDFGGSLSEILSQSQQSRQLQHQPSTTEPTRSTTVPPLPRRRRTVDAVSASDFGGSLSDIMPPVPQPQRRQRRTQPNTNNSRRSTAERNNGTTTRANTTTSRSSNRRLVPPPSNSSSSSSGRVAVTNDDQLLREFMQHDDVVVGGHRPRPTNSGNFMEESEMTYDRLLALDESVNRRLTVAEKSKETTPEALFKSLRTMAYRSKKKSRTKKQEITKDKQEKVKEEEEEDECAICLEEFKHRETLKRFPCGHCFHSKCAKEMLKFDTRCALCRYDLITKTHG